jgi:trigger factor
MQAKQFEEQQAVALAVKLPGLDGIRVDVAEPDGITEGDIWERLDEWLAAASFKRDRSAGETIEVDDIVTLNVVGFKDGALLKGTLMRAWEVRVESVESLPGFFEALVGHKVGDIAQIEVTLAESYPVEDLRGQAVAFTVSIDAAQQVRWGSLDDAVVLARINKGSTADAVIEAAAAELEEESMFAAQRETEARVLDAVLGEAELDLSPELLEAEMMHVFAASEGQALQEMGLDQAMQNEALTRYMHDDDERLDVAVRICNNALLHAVATQYNLTPSLQQVGIEASEKELRLSGLWEQARRQAALDFLVEKCTNTLNSRMSS